jgi:hypothetical protein
MKTGGEVNTPRNLPHIIFIFKAYIDPGNLRERVHVSYNQNQMKRSDFWAILMIALFFASCEKDRDDKKVYNIYGEWTWLESVGGMTGSEVLNPENTGTVRTATFYKNDTVIITENGEIAHKTDYFLSREKSNLFNDTCNFVTINYKYPISNPDTVITLSMRYMIEDLSDTLLLDEDVYDGYRHLYVRKKR